MELGVEREERTIRLQVTPARITDDKGNSFGRIGAELSDRLPPIKVQYGPIESIPRAVEKTADTAVFSLKMLGKMLTGEASWRNLSGTGHDRRLRGANRAHRPRCVSGLSRSGIDQSRSVEPVTDPDARWRAPTVLSNRNF